MLIYQDFDYYIWLKNTFKFLEKIKVIERGYRLWFVHKTSFIPFSGYTLTIFDVNYSRWLIKINYSRWLIKITIDMPNTLWFWIDVYKLIVYRLCAIIFAKPLSKSFSALVTSTLKMSIAWVHLLSNSTSNQSTVSRLHNLRRGKKGDISIGGENGSIPYNLLYLTSHTIYQPKMHHGPRGSTWLYLSIFNSTLCLK